MDEAEFSAALAGLPLGGLRFFGSIGSTNDEAIAWAQQGAPDLAVVAADEQTAGRGRSGRKWHTPPGAAVALSVVVRPTREELSAPARLTGLGALAVVQCCRELGLQAQIKWPNDVLLGGRKVAGILVESDWEENRLRASVVGIGVNVKPPAVPPPETLSFAATSLESEAGKPLAPADVLRGILTALLDWRARIGTAGFVQAWEAVLAYRNEEISVGAAGEEPARGRLQGLEPDGSLRIVAGGTNKIVYFGEIHLRRGNDRIG